MTPDAISIGWLMDNRSTAKVMYAEPAQGLREDGEEATCDREITMTVDHAIMHARYCGMRLRPEVCKRLSDMELLEEFIIVHWAVHESGRPIRF